MKLQQLRYIWEVSKNDLNISATALALYTSQPGVSKQIRLLENELGLEVFYRSGKHLTKVTPAGEKVLELAGEILGKVEEIKRFSHDFKNPDIGTLGVATTETQARYTLPSVVEDFIAKYPKITLNMIQGSNTQICEAAVEGSVDFGITTEKLDCQHNLVMMPCFDYGSVILVPKGHPLSHMAEVTLDDIDGYPLLVHVVGPPAVNEIAVCRAFIQQGLKPNIVFTSENADVLKAYVGAGLGIAVVANLAYNEILDRDLVSVNAPSLLDSYLTSIVIRKGIFLRGYMYDFIESFAPHLTRMVVDEVMLLTSPEAQESYFSNVAIPTR
jgi:LysR family cys regulon transcriptional activator